jgi:hypothetical protein
MLHRIRTCTKYKIATATLLVSRIGCGKKKAHGYAKTENVDVVAHKYIFHDHNLVISPTRAEKIARLRRKDRTLDTT